MDTISGFWAGAHDLADKLPLEDIAARAGGWRALTRLGVVDLVQLDVPKPLAQQWLGAEGRHTRGMAVTRAHPLYPPRLATRPDAPPVLFVEGDPELLCSPGVAVVGTRNCTPYGASVARHLGATLSQAGWTTVSGLARGIDTHAHRGALGGGRTIAVLGHGLDHTSPQSNVGLRAAIVAEGGTVVTAFPDPQPPTRWTFPSRNRWIAGMVDDVVVVEAPARSGALITASLALDLGIDVHVVPGHVGVRACRGSNALIADGAHPILEVDAFVTGLTGWTHPDARPPWLDVVLAGGTLDQAAHAAGTTPLVILEDLTRLELQGHLVRLPGGRYAAAGGHRSTSITPSR